MSGTTNPSETSGLSQGSVKIDPKPRSHDGIYQNDCLVGRVTEPKIDLEAKEIAFKEIYESDFLLLPDECEFEDYKILVQKIESATMVGSRGRVLMEVRAEILGRREQ